MIEQRFGTVSKKDGQAANGDSRNIAVIPLAPINLNAMSLSAPNGTGFRGVSVVATAGQPFSSRAEEFKKGRWLELRSSASGPAAGITTADADAQRVVEALKAAVTACQP